MSFLGIGLPAAVEEWSTQSRGDGGVRNEGATNGSGRRGGRGARAPLGREGVGRGVGARGTEDAGPDCGGSLSETDGRA